MAKIELKLVVANQQARLLDFTQSSRESFKPWHDIKVEATRQGTESLIVLGM